MEEQKTLEEAVTVKPKKRAPRKPKEKVSKAPSKNHPKRKELFLEDGTVNYVNTVGGCYEETVTASTNIYSEPLLGTSQEEEDEITRRTYEQLVKQVEEETDKEFYWYIFKLLILAVILLGAALAL